ncbi:MAG: DUF420 domain-containing protein [Nitrospiraceae bacterium]
MAEWLRQPGFFLTHATIGADLSQLMATLFTGLFIIGWVQGRRGAGHAHHWLMLGGMITMLVFFVNYYLFRSLGVLAYEGKEGFGGPESLYYSLFIPLLIFHIALVIIGLVMAVYMIVLGFRSQVVVGGKRTLKNAVLQTSWRKVGMIFGGVVGVLALLFLSRVATAGFSMRKLEVYLAFLILLVIVFGLELLIQRIWPNGERRHRALGLFTMVIYCVLFLTGTFTYTLLYILYPGKIG